MARRTATGPNGEKLVLEGGKWVPLENPPVGPVDQFSGPLPSLGRTPAEQTTALRQGLRSAGGSFVSNLLSTPHAAGELLAAGAAIPQTVGGAAIAAMRGQPMNLGERFTAARKEQESSFPASALLKIPDPTAEDVLAVPGALAKSFSNINANAQRARTLMGDPNAEVGPLRPPQLSETYPEALAEQKGRSEENPIASGAGRVAGDIATLMTLRPGTRAVKALGLEPRAALPAGAKAAEYLKRGASRAAEAGIDGATLAALGDGDPVKTAAYSAGAQALGSAALGTKGWVWGNLGSNAVRLWMGHEIFKTVMPGPQSALESKDQVFQEIVGAYVAGTAAAMLGAGRGFGAGKTRQLTDLLSTGSRGTIASVVTQLQEASSEGNAIPARVLELMGQNPDYFGSEVRKRLEQAADSEEPRALLNEIDELMATSLRFRQALEPEQQAASTQSFGDFLKHKTGGGF